MDLTLADAKTAARTLRRTLAATDVSISHSRALEIVAAQLGFADWNTASARLPAGPSAGPEAAPPAGPSGAPTGSGPTHFGRAVPVLRIQDEARAREFYVDYLGFDVEWEHRFEPGMPLYLRAGRPSISSIRSATCCGSAGRRTDGLAGWRAGRLTPSRRADAAPDGSP